MPRVPRNPGSGKKPYNGPSKGAGWGGPANGSSGNSRQDFTEENAAEVGSRGGKVGVAVKRHMKQQAQAAVAAYNAAHADEPGFTPLEKPLSRKQIREMALLAIPGGIAEVQRIMLSGDDKEKIRAFDALAKVADVYPSARETNLNFNIDDAASRFVEAARSALRRKIADGSGGAVTIDGQPPVERPD